MSPVCRARSGRSYREPLQTPAPVASFAADTAATTDTKATNASVPAPAGAWVPTEAPYADASVAADTATTTNSEVTNASVSSTAEYWIPAEAPDADDPVASDTTATAATKATRAPKPVLPSRLTDPLWQCWPAL